MHGDPDGPRRTSRRRGGLGLAATVSVGALALGQLLGAAPTAASGIGTGAAPASPVLDQPLDPGPPGDGWHWDDSFPGPGDVAPFAATTSDHPLNFVASIPPAA